MEKPHLWYLEKLRILSPHLRKQVSLMEEVSYQKSWGKLLILFHKDKSIRDLISTKIRAVGNVHAGIQMGTRKCESSPSWLHSHCGEPWLIPRPLSCTGLPPHVMPWLSSVRWEQIMVCEQEMFFLIPSSLPTERDNILTEQLEHF